MKKLPDYFQNWELLLIPAVAALGFGVNLIYSSMVLSDERSNFQYVRDADFPILEEADNNLNRYQAVIVALNSAAATGEMEFLHSAMEKASEIRAGYEVLAKLDTRHQEEIDKLKSEFNTYFDLAIYITQQMATKTGTPSFQQISKMRVSRDIYLAGSTKYRDATKKEFHSTISESIAISQRAQRWVAAIGFLMLLAIAALTWLVKRDIAKRKQMETLLRNSEEASRIAATAFETHDAIVITDTQANIVRVNRAFSSITGYPAGEVLGKNPRMMKSDRHDRFFYNKMWQQLLQTGTWAGEIWDQRKNGDIYPKWITITAVKNDRHETTHYVGIFSDITARKRAEDEIHNLAYYDALTGLPNRRLFLDRLQIAQATSARHADFGALLFIDLDRFKSLNDTLGHDYGDLLLIEVGARIKSCVREMDMAARFGGDEFVVLLEAVSNDRGDAARKVALVAEKIRETLSLPYKLKEHEHHSSPSIGASFYHGLDESRESLLEQADMAMYQAKKSGRNAVRFFDPVAKKEGSTKDATNQDRSRPESA